MFAGYDQYFFFNNPGLLQSHNSFVSFLGGVQFVNPWNRGAIKMLRFRFCQGEVTLDLNLEICPLLSPDFMDEKWEELDLGT